MEDEEEKIIFLYVVVLCIFSIKCDLVVVSCDTVTNIDLFAMLNCFRQNNASIVAQLFKAGLEVDTVIPGPKMKHKIGIQFACS